MVHSDVEKSQGIALENKNGWDRRRAGADSDPCHRADMRPNRYACAPDPAPNGHERVAAREPDRADNGTDRASKRPRLLVGSGHRENHCATKMRVYTYGCLPPKRGSGPDRHPSPPMTLAVGADFCPDRHIPPSDQKSIFKFASGFFATKFRLKLPSVCAHRPRSCVSELQCSKKPTRFSARGTSKGRSSSTPSSLASSWPLETKTIHRTTSDFAVTRSSSICNFSSSTKWGPSACGFW